jgi:hypothetical protein
MNLMISGASTSLPAEGNAPNVSSPESRPTLAATVQHNPALVAGLIARYQQQHGLDDAALLDLLHIDEFGLARLVLARRPRVESWQADLQALAEISGCAEAALHALLRAVDASYPPT